TLTSGVGTFPVTLTTAGSEVVTATDVLDGITGFTTILVTPGPVATVMVSNFPSPVTAGSTASVDVTLKDSFGNVCTNLTGNTLNVSVTPTSVNDVLPTGQSLPNGTGSIGGIVLTVAAGTNGTTLRVTETATGAFGEQVVTVDPAAANHLTIAVGSGPVT